MIRTVAGDIENDALGFCSSHDHAYINGRELGERAPSGALDDFAFMRCSLARFYESGGRAIVDAQPGDCGRDIAALTKLSAQTCVHIIASAGFHLRAFYRPELDPYAETDAALLAERFISQLAVNCGVIKTAATPIWREEAPRLFEAARTAARLSGAPVMIHLDRGARPLSLIDFFASGGIAPQRLIFCHADRALPEISDHLSALREGVYFEYDTIARYKYHSDAREAEIIMQALEAGFADKLLLGMDTTPARAASLGFAYLTGFGATLEKYGVPEAAFAKMCRANPARAFDFKQIGGN